MIYINGISYTPKASSNVKLVEIPLTGQTPLAESQESIDSKNYRMSTRNGAGSYILPTDADKLYLNFIPQKVVVDDQSIGEILQPQFQYFIEAVMPEQELFNLPDGIIFRCVSIDSIPMDKSAYTYYIMIDGVARRIPNYKTLEVLLYERNQTLLSVRVIEENQCDELTHAPDPIPDKSGAWKSAYSDLSSMEAFQELGQNALGAAEIAEGAKAQAEEQIEAVKSQAAADKADAEAAKADSEAAKAELETKKAELDVKMAELEAKISELD